MDKLKSILYKIKTVEFRAYALSTVVVVVSVFAVGAVAWTVNRMLHNESLLPSFFSSTHSAAGQESGGVSAGLPGGTDNQSLQSDLTVVQNEMVQSTANINSAQAAVDSQGSGN